MARDKRDTPVLGNPLLVLELCELPGEVGRTYSIVASCPGREGTVIQRWVAPNGVVSDGQVNDMLARVDRWVLDAFLTLGGIQASLMAR